MVTLDEKLRYAHELSKADIAPNGYRGNPPNVLFAVEFALARGLDSITALTGLQVVPRRNKDGTVTNTVVMSTHMMAALARKAGHKLRITELTDDSATAELVRVDDPDYTHKVTYTIQEANAAGLTKSFDNRPTKWDQNRKQMLRARVQTEIIRQAASDVLAGVWYTPDDFPADEQAEAPAGPQQPPRLDPDSFKLAVASAGFPELISLNEHLDGQGDDMKAVYAARLDELADAAVAQIPNTGSMAELTVLWNQLSHAPRVRAAAKDQFTARKAEFEAEREQTDEEGVNA